MEIWVEEYYTELETIGPLRTVYHAVPHCPIGRRIPVELRRNGRGDQLEICPACEARLNARRWNPRSQVGLEASHHPPMRYRPRAGRTEAVGEAARS
jgi:hypothetical protein